MAKQQMADSIEWENGLAKRNFVRTVVVKKEGSYPTSHLTDKLFMRVAEILMLIPVSKRQDILLCCLFVQSLQNILKRGEYSLAPNAGNKEVKFNESGSLDSSLPHCTLYVRGRRVTGYENRHLQEILVADKDSYLKNMSRIFSDH